MRVTYGRGSVFLWRRTDTLCTSDFMDDDIFARELIGFDAVGWAAGRASGL